ncbi:hypothetical protein HY251_20510 [bacterium]|nr:hypothetical protein [bacterium]
MGLFERAKHFERLAHEIADENLRRLGGARAPDDGETRRRLLELEALLREYRLNLVEADARRQLAQVRADAAREKAERWRANVDLGREKERQDLADQALSRALVYERERELAAADADQQSAATARLRAEISSLERKVEAVRAIRRGSARMKMETPPATPGPPTRRLLTPPPQDALEAAFEQLRDERPPPPPSS